MKHVNAVTDQKGLAQKYPPNLYWFLRWYFLAKALWQHGMTSVNVLALHQLNIQICTCYGLGWEGRKMLT